MKLGNSSDTILHAWFCCIPKLILFFHTSLYYNNIFVAILNFFPQQNVYFEVLNWNWCCIILCNVHVSFISNTNSLCCFMSLQYFDYQAMHENDQSCMGLWILLAWFVHVVDIPLGEGFRHGTFLEYIMHV